MRWAVGLVRETSVLAITVAVPRHDGMLRSFHSATFIFFKARAADARMASL
jgi:hypothetical protein